MLPLMDDLIIHGLRKTRDKKSVGRGVMLGIQIAVDAESLGKVVKVWRGSFWLVFGRVLM